jgi:hypothetical protein
LPPNFSTLLREGFGGIFQVIYQFTRKMGKSLALLGRLPEQLNVLSAIFCDKLGE